MKTLKTIGLSQSFLAVAALIVVMTLAAPAEADTAQMYFGNTAVELDDDFLDAFDDIDAIEPAYIFDFGFSDDVVARFPIPGGIFDFDTNLGDIFHVGGLSLTIGGTNVRLYNFIIDTNDLVLTGRVVVDGAVVGNRIDLFKLVIEDPDDDIDVYWDTLLIIRDVELKLAATAAVVLNVVFSSTVFEEDLPVGEARVVSWFHD